VQALGGLAFYLVYAETLDRVFVALMPFPVGEAQIFTVMIEVVRDENGWWDWLDALERIGILRLSEDSQAPITSPLSAPKASESDATMPFVEPRKPTCSPPGQ
jgi:hypothetical protein